MFNELLAELENKIGGLAQTLEELKGENASLREQLGGADALRGENKALKVEKDELARQLSEAKAESDGQREKADAAVGRIKEIIAKLDSAR